MRPVVWDTGVVGIGVHGLAERLLRLERVAAGGQGSPQIHEQAGVVGADVHSRAPLGNRLIPEAAGLVHGREPRVGHVQAGIVLERFAVQLGRLIDLTRPLLQNGDDVPVLVGLEGNVEDQRVRMLVGDGALQQPVEVPDGFGVASDVRRGEAPVVEHEVG